MAKQTKKTTENEVKKPKTKEIKKIEKEVEVVKNEEKKKAGRPPKAPVVEKLPTASLKELEEQGSNYIMDVDIATEGEDYSSVNIMKMTDGVIENVTDVLNEYCENNNPEPVEEKESFSEIIEQIEAPVENTDKNELAEENTKQNVIEKIELSHMAKKYKTYIEYIKMTPEQFVAKYPNHKFIKCVHEIIEWKVKTGGE